MPLRLMLLGDRIIGGTSAYSKVGYETSKELTRIGCKIAHIPMSRANRMGKQVYENVLIYPSGDNPFGEDVAVRHYLDFKADMLITIKEPWVFEHIHKIAINFVPMAIVDHSPVSAMITSRLHTAFKVIAISHHAQGQLKNNNIESTYIPHGVRTDIYRPLEHKKECRKMFFLDPDEFVVGIVAMNRTRKMIPRMLQGYKRFLELNPDVKSHLMLWTNVEPQVFEESPKEIADLGAYLLPEIMELGLGEAVKWPDREIIQQGLPEWAGEDYRGGWDMVKLFNCFDVLLLCSGGEGFGLPLIEAQSVGCPVITTDYAAGPEQVGVGLTVPYDGYVILNSPGTRYALADIDKMAEAISKIMNANHEKLAKGARQFAMKYDWKVIVERYWKPFLEECEEELYPLVTSSGTKPWGL